MRWQQTLQDALNYKNTIILCGNVRDKYLYLEPHTDDAYRLLNLKEYLIEFLGRQVNILRFYDPIRKKTEYSQTAAPSQKRAAASNDPFAGTEPESDEDEWGRESKIEADLERIREEATSEEQLWWVLQYADKITPEKSNSAEERKLILRIEKLIENLPSWNKLFLV
ncbi:MAG: hypothetical protein GY801_04405 [bacterium]|nr:hypothetical protein [bacterium]